ncbi:guanitoxin biosynthesis heme-dependent pre-guanitoxin N-hydroxylase GntA [Erythrobacter sp. NE805]|uniref:guanitoxin biosynthesis heme-dependent pre-guanitoxin N-hydroxylase GntA n=1 Tax=Erythrobacter sp. NE805 TaxID=3389875 RepID=UPI00396B0F7B
MNFIPAFRRNWPLSDEFPLAGDIPARDPEASCPRLGGALTRLVEDPEFPCVGAKSALAQGNLEIMTAASLDSDADDARIHRRLVAWSRAAKRLADGFRSLVVVFAGPVMLDERGFEARLWERLAALRALDRRRGYAQAAGFSADPAAPDFALSFGGEAYFAVGLHPGASRRARRLPYPGIVFNLHSQFAALRADGRYEKMRSVILARDAAFAGSVNPMVARHGEISEARQYSGRAVGDDWVCPMAANLRGDA